MNRVDAARSYVAHHWPDALAALLGGGSATGVVTPTSDLDIVLLLDGARAPKRMTTVWEGITVEVFAHTAESLRRYWAKDTADRKPALIRMCAESVILVSVGARAEAIQEEADRLLHAGPPEPEPAELARRRYGITDLLDDLAGDPSHVERPFVLANLFVEVAELALLAARHWSGTGKWLARELADLDPRLCERLVAGHREALLGSDDMLIGVADAVLAGVGGRLTVGYEARGEQP